MSGLIEVEKCLVSREELLACLDGTMPDDEAAQLRHHMVRCDDCLAKLAEMGESSPLGTKQQNKLPEWLAEGLANPP